MYCKEGESNNVKSTSTTQTTTKTPSYVAGLILGIIGLVCLLIALIGTGFYMKNNKDLNKELPELTKSPNGYIHIRDIVSYIRTFASNNFLFTFTIMVYLVSITLSSLSVAYSDNKKLGGSGLGLSILGILILILFNLIDKGMKADMSDKLSGMSGSIINILKPKSKCKWSNTTNNTIINQNKL